MFPERRLRSKRRGLNPTKAVFVYVAALCLVCFHQAGQVADWLDELALGSSGFVSESAFKLSASLRSVIVPRGPAQMNRAEDRLLALAPSGLLGQKSEALPLLMPGQLSQVVRKLEPLPQFGRPEGLSPVISAMTTPPTFIYKAASGSDARLLPVTVDDDRPDVFNPANVLLLGDSMMLEGLGPQLQRELKKHDGLNVNRDGRYGTGLARLDAFDWVAYFDQILAKYDPDLIIMTLGANDTQDILDPEGPKKRIPVASAEWNAIYAGRVSTLLRKAALRDTQIFWVGLPIMGQEPYGKRAANINKVTAEVCGAAANCRFWDSWLSVADDQGQYATFIRDDAGKSIRIRAKDAIHLTEAGGRIMTRKFLADTSTWAEYDQNTSGDPTPNFLENENIPPPAAAAPPVERPRPNEQASPAPSAGEVYDDEDPAVVSPLGAVTEHRFFSKIKGKEIAYFTAVPAGTGPFPVVLLLHGAWDGAGAWAENLGRDELARLAAEHKLFLVMPDGEPFGWYLDGRETAIESFLIKELIPQVRRDQRADSDRVGITGLSMGGHGALTLALKYPLLFKAAGAMSGITDLAAHNGPGHKLNSALGIDRVLGPAGRDGQLWRRHSAQGLIEGDPALWSGRPLIISVGRYDRLTIDENRAFHNLLTRLNIAHIYHEDDGGHDWEYWAGQIPVHLEFIGGKLREAN